MIFSKVKIAQNVLRDWPCKIQVSLEFGLHSTRCLCSIIFGHPTIYENTRQIPLAHSKHSSPITALYLFDIVRMLLCLWIKNKSKIYIFMHVCFNSVVFPQCVSYRISPFGVITLIIISKCLEDLRWEGSNTFSATATTYCTVVESTVLRFISLDFIIWGKLPSTLPFAHLQAFHRARTNNNRFPITQWNSSVCFIESLLPYTVDSNAMVYFRVILMHYVNVTRKQKKVEKKKKAKNTFKRVY